MIIFETERLRVRRFHHGDGENFFLVNGDPDVVRFIRPAKSREECDQFLLDVIAAYSSLPAYGRWAVDRLDSGIFVGSFSMLTIKDTDKIHLGYALLPDYWGKGYATELTQFGIGYTFNQTVLEEIYAITETANTGSVQVLNKTGFTEELQYRDEYGKPMLRFVLQKKAWQSRLI